MRIAPKLTLFILALVLLLAAAPLAAQDADAGPNIYPRLAARLVDMGVPVLDVRSEEEVAETGRIADATRISHDDLTAIQAFLGDDPNAAVVIYCGSGRRASRVIAAMRERGYGGLVNGGGFNDLTAALQASPAGG